jgi:serine/threonine protein phosphatase PrpC
MSADADKPPTDAPALDEARPDSSAPEVTVTESADEGHAESADAKPAESTDAKPAESTDAKPAESTDAKPAESTDAKPAESADAKPDESTDAKPDASTDAMPDESTDEKPVASDEPAKDDAATAATTRQDGTDPVVVPTPLPKVIVQIAGLTDVGRIREHNEDNLLIADLSVRGRDGGLFDSTVEVGADGLLLAVCDGMGGALAGEVASQMAVDVVHGIVQDGVTPADEDGFAQKLVAAVQEAGARIYLAAKTNRNQHGMGTTATVAGVSAGRVYVGQVGDSRAYLMRRGKLRQITKDQSLVSKLIEAGRLTEEEAESYEHAHIILQALGTSDAVCVDLSFADLRKGDVLMLCSDGLSGLATPQQIREILASGASPMRCAEQLTDAANDAGGHDNITVVVARFDGELPDATDEDEIQGYQAHVLSRPVESLVGGRASTSMKIPDLPPPGSDLKNRVSLPPDAPGMPKYDDDDDDDEPSRSPVTARPPARPRGDDDNAVALPMRSSPWGPLVLAALVVGALLGAWLALRDRGEPDVRNTPAVTAPTATPETPIDTAHPVDPTPLPAPAWDDAGAPGDA